MIILGISRMSAVFERFDALEERRFVLKLESCEVEGFNDAGNSLCHCRRSLSSRLSSSNGRSGDADSASWI